MMSQNKIQVSTEDTMAVETWSLRRLHGLDPHEHDFQEFKSSEWLCQNDEIQSDFIQLLSKQVSAFTNGAGGILIIGMRDNGQLDEGVHPQLKGGTREWLEDVVN